MDVTHILAPYLAGATAMAGLVVPITSFVRKHILTRMDGWEVVAFAAVLANAFSLAGVATHVVAWTWLQGLAFGTFAGIYSAGLVATLKGGTATVVNSLEGILKGFLPAGTAPSSAAPAADAGKSPAPSTPPQG